MLAGNKPISYHGVNGDYMGLGISTCIQQLELPSIKLIDIKWEA